MKNFKQFKIIKEAFFKKIKKHEKLVLFGGIVLCSLVVLGVSWYINSQKRTTDTQAQEAGTFSAGGQPVEDGEYPFVVYLTNDRGNSFCSGSLISDHWVLSNAHCSFVTQVAVGYYSLADSVSPGCTLDSTEVLKSNERCYVRIAEKFPHPNYNGDIGFNDLMLVKLARKVEHTPISLPSDKNLINNTKYGQLVGYGRTDTTDNPSKDSWPVIANKLNGEIIYISNRNNDKYVVYNSQLVYSNATIIDHTARPGDSGSPVLSWSKNNRKMYQISINRGGGAGSSIAHHIEWIKEVTGVENFESSYIGKPLTIEGSSHSLGYTCDEENNSIELSWNINADNLVIPPFTIRVMKRNDSDVYDNTYNTAYIDYNPDTISDNTKFVLNQTTLTTTSEQVDIKWRFYQS